MPPNKKTQRAEIDDFVHVRGSFPQMSFDLGHQGEMTIAPGEQGTRSGFGCEANKMPTEDAKISISRIYGFLLGGNFSCLLFFIKHPPLLKGGCLF